MRQLQPSAILSAACCAAVMLAAAAPAGAAPTLPRFGGIVFPGKAEPLPKIDNVEFSGGSAGINVTLNGSNFGTAPVDVPCNQCTPIEVQVLDLAVEGVPEVINVASWTNTSISLPNLTVNPGDALEIDVYSDSVGNAGAWGGVVPREKGLPKITSIKISGSGAALTVTVNGSGFGSAPSGVGQNGNSPFFVFSDVNNASTGTGGERWNAGFCGSYECDGVTMGYVSWSDTQIVMSGFGSSYGSNNWFVNPSDAFCVGVWPSTSTSDGTTGGTAKCGRLPK